MRNGIIAATIVAIAVGGSALLLAGGDSKPGSSSAKSGGGALLKGDKVNIADFKFKPPNFSVKVGTKVSFTNEDTAPHTATSKTAGAFDTGKLTKGKSEAVTFSKAGDFKYYCVYHAFMTGDVKVVQ